MTSTSIYLLIFFAAFLHAVWNIIIKSLNNSLVAIAVKVFFQSIIFTPIIFFVPLPEGITWFYLIASALLHSFYFILLGIMYNREDLTFIYPVARGCAPIFVTILSLIFLIDSLTFSLSIDFSFATESTILKSSCLSKPLFNILFLAPKKKWAKAHFVLSR